MATAARPQLAFDEKAVTDAALENALEARQNKYDAVKAVRHQFDEAHEAAQAEIAKLDMADGTAVRVGRFRIERRFVAGGSRSFDTKARSQTRIALADED